MPKLRSIFAMQITVSLAVVITPVLAQPAAVAEQIQQIADASQCSKLREAPTAFFRGMALVFARRLCHPERPDVQVASSPLSAPIAIGNSRDAASVFDAEFRTRKIPNSPDMETMF